MFSIIIFYLLNYNVRKLANLNIYYHNHNVERKRREVKFEYLYLFRVSFGLILVRTIISYFNKD